jgi:hypothetical protein
MGPLTLVIQFLHLDQALLVVVAVLDSVGSLLDDALLCRCAWVLDVRRHLPSRSSSASALCVVETAGRVIVLASVGAAAQGGEDADKNQSERRHAGTNDSNIDLNDGPVGNANKIPGGV